jgi:hypothetical protein
MTQARYNVMTAAAKPRACLPSSFQIETHCGWRSKPSAASKTPKSRPSIAWRRSVCSVTWETDCSDQRASDDFERSVDWLHELAPWTTAATFTFKRQSRYGKSTNWQAVVGAVKHFLRVLSSLCFGLKNVKRGQYVASVVIADMGPSGLHPHIHMSLVRPASLRDGTFRSHIRLAARKTALFDLSCQIRPYQDRGWSRYLLNHGVNRLVDSLLRVPA